MPPSRIFLFTLASFITGIGIRLYITVPVAFLLVLLLISCFLFVRGVIRRERKFFIVALCIVGCIAGIARVAYAEHHLPDFSLFTGKRIVISGIVTDARVTNKGQILIINTKTINGRALTMPRSVLVFLRSYPRYKEEDSITAEGLFGPKPYDGKTFGMLLASRSEKTGQESSNVVMRILRKSRHAFEANLDAVLPEPHAGFMKGLLLGEKTALPADLLEKFKTTGTSHIIALSGYNITLVGALLVEILLFFTVPFRMTFWIAGASIILFVLLAGAASSLTRAAIMGILILIASREGRPYHMTNALACAGAVMLAINPYVLRFDIGFQLSFLATLGLVHLTDPVDRAIVSLVSRIKRLRGIKRIQQKEHTMILTLRKIASETIAAQLAVLPLVVYLFGGVSLIAPASNLFVLALIPSAMAMGFLAGVAGFLWHPLSQMVAWGAWIILEYELRVIDFFARVPLSFLHVSFLGFVGVVAIYAIVALRHAKNSYKKIIDHGIV